MTKKNPKPRLKTSSQRPKTGIVEKSEISAEEPHPSPTEGTRPHAQDPIAEMWKKPRLLSKICSPTLNGKTCLHLAAKSLLLENAKKFKTSAEKPRPTSKKSAATFPCAVRRFNEPAQNVEKRRIGAEKETTNLFPVAEKWDRLKKFTDSLPNNDSSPEKTAWCEVSVPF